MTLMLTRDAAEAIRGITELPGAEGVRIFPATQSLDTQGPGLQIEPAAGPHPQDAVVEAEGARLFLAPEAAETIEGKVLDADIEGGEVRFGLVEQSEQEPGG